MRPMNSSKNITKFIIQLSQTHMTPQTNEAKNKFKIINK